MKKSKKARRYVYILLIAIALILIFLFIPKPAKDTLEVDYVFKVNKTPLLKVWKGVDYVDFGVLIPQGIMIKTINLTHTYNFPMAVDSSVVADTADWVEVSVPGIIPVGGYVIANISITPPQNAAYGNYSGTVIFTLTKAD